MTFFSLRPLCLAFCLVLAGVTGAPGAEVSGRFDGVWVGLLHDVYKCDQREVVLSVESNRLTTTIDGREVNAEVGSDGTVSWRARGRSAGWTPEELYFSGQFIDDRFEGKFVATWTYSYSCRAVVKARLRGPVPQPATKADTATVGAASPPRKPATASVAATRPSPPPAAAAGPAPIAAAKDETPPVIDVPDTIATDGAVVEIAGRVADRSLVAEVTVEGRPIPVAGDGSFSVRRVVPVGTSSLRVAALDEWGNRAESSISVTRQAASVAAATPRVAAPRDTTPPVIEVPAALKTDKTVVDLAGKVTDASRVVELTLDGQPLQLAGDGGFTARRGVAVGPSVLELAAVDEWGNRSVRRVQVTRLTPAEALGIDFGRYHALVIGNDTYRHLPKLNTAVDDARAVAETLRRDYGFQVDLLENATGYEIKSSMSRLRRTLTENDNLLVYYAGHGLVDKEAEAGFWLPVDAERDSDANWIANSYLTRNLRALSAKHVMVVADSCYSGTLVRAAPAKFGSAHERAAWLARMAQKRSRTALVSGGLEPVMDSGGSGHSVFAKAFLAALADNDGVIDGQSLFEMVQRPVILNSDQTPDYADIRRAGHDGGDFLLVRR